MRHTAGTDSCPNEGVEMSGKDPKEFITACVDSRGFRDEGESLVAAEPHWEARISFVLDSGLASQKRGYTGNIIPAVDRNAIHGLLFAAHDSIPYENINQANRASRARWLSPQPFRHRRRTTFCPTRSASQGTHGSPRGRVRHEQNHGAGRFHPRQTRPPIRSGPRHARQRRMRENNAQETRSDFSG